MPKLIKNGQLIDDDARILILDETQAPEELTLADGPVFVPFAVLYMKEPLSWNYLWAGLCLMGAVFFIFRGP